MNLHSRILITGGSGLLGTALTCLLKERGFTQVTSLSSKDLDLRSLEATTDAWCHRYRPELVFHLAGAVFGLGGNLARPAEIFLANTLINTHVVEASRRSGVQKIVAMGSICAYPSPFHGYLKEEDLFMGEPGPGERAYGQSKRALLAHLEAVGGDLNHAFMLSTNLYGPNDRFNLHDGHVVPSLIRKFREAAHSGTSVRVWGDGTSARDFMHSRDAAAALILAMEKLSGRVNLATGRMTRIHELVALLGRISGVGSRVIFDNSKPRGHEFDGISVDRLSKAGFSPHISLEAGIEAVYRWYEAHAHEARA